MPSTVQHRPRPVALHDRAPRTSDPLAGPALALSAAAFVLGLAWAPILALVVVLAVLAVGAADAVRCGGVR